MTTPTQKQGEIWVVRFDPTIGSEMQKTRPALVISANTIGLLPLRVVVPITGWDDAYANFPWLVALTPTPLNGLIKLSAADAFQVKSLSVERFVERRGRVTKEEFERVLAALATCFEPGDDLDE